MKSVSNRFVGGVVASAGLLLSLFHLSHLTAFRPNGVFPEGSTLVLSIVLSLVMTAVGAMIALDRLVSSRSAGRILAWTGIGVVALSLLGAWIVVSIAGGELSLLNPLGPMLTVATFGALVGLLVGLYDVRGLEHQQSVEQSNRINDTLRIATQELVNKTERSALERAVCEKLTESEAYEAVWIGRYDEADPTVRAAAWSGFTDDYFESIVITVDDSPTGNGAGGRAIKSREIQCVPNVFDDPTMEPWWDLLEMHGVRSLAVIPITHDDTVYGFFSIYADRQSVFGDREQEVLVELGETIGHAIASIEARERLADQERELARQNEQLDAFAGVVSHDLRNPLNVAMGNLDLAREQGDDVYFSRSADALDRMDDLVTDLLTLARQGETVDEFDQVSLREVVEAAWSTAGSSAATLRIDGELGTVSCDRGRLRQLLENLLRNSVEHGSTNGRPKVDDGVEHAGSDVTVTVRRTNAGFAVDDDGPGIPTERRRAVFEAGHTTNQDGTGFGLNIVRSIAEAHGWEVSVGESPDGGARFEFVGVELIDAVTDAP
ncbi:ATP-binding protein [Natrinema zhouii]|uniref:histidine kinase n=1 Tax=Natrinema zhouii TaxID=1710539 RepID=A0A7D6H156_9EURY|nr:HAMP domain-containing sensor histidine kinase [Natrinema zhouii]QLK24667.1 ATP-binding protein [Natrinema zhouii]